MLYYRGLKRRLGGCSPVAWLKRLPVCSGARALCRLLRSLLRRRLVRVALVLWLMLYLLFTLHTRVLPKASGAYNEDCYLQEARKERMRFVLRHVVTFLNEENVTYWLDYGTFLGVVREGDIIAHDGDMDVSRMADDLEADRRMVSRFTARMREVGIEGTDLVARYKDVQVDMFRWQTRNSSGTTWIYLYYPFTPAWSLAEAISDFFFPRHFPAHILLPLRKIGIFGVYANIPCRALDFMRHRYPLTWFLTFPYKWKCWVRRN